MKDYITFASLRDNVIKTIQESLSSLHRSEQLLRERCIAYERLRILNLLAKELETEHDRLPEDILVHRTRFILNLMQTIQQGE